MKKSLFFLLGLLLLTSSISAYIIEINDENGVGFTIGVDHNDSFFDVANKINTLIPGMEENSSIILAIPLPMENSSQLAKVSFWNMFTSTKKPGGYLGYPRNYYHPINDDQRKCIQFIFTTLGFRSLTTIMRQKIKLQEAGWVIDPLHPLQVLLIALLDEVIQKAFRNMRGRGWIWGDFMAGMKNSLFTESEHDNLKPVVVADFCRQLNLDFDLIYNLIQTKSWDKFIDVLIANIPRNELEDRFND